jgi:hemerythrin-like metal-binding protein
MATKGGVFRWAEADSVNIALLDQQHQALFATVDELNRALAAGKGNELLIPILQKLVDYALHHFATEESLMEEHDFPGFSTHRARHEMFRQEVAVFLKDYKAGSLGIPVELTFFLQSWLKEHVQRIDQEYSQFLNARGVR